MSTCMCAKSFESCPTLCEPMDCSLPGSSVHGILQARIFKWAAMPYFSGSCQLSIKPTSFTTPELAGGLFTTSWASLVAQRLKCLPAMRETWVQSLGQEDPLEKEMATYSSILAWRIPWTEESVGLQSTGSQRVGHDWATSRSFFSFFLYN